MFCFKCQIWCVQIEREACWSACAVANLRLPRLVCELRRCSWCPGCSNMIQYEWFVDKDRQSILCKRDRHQNTMHRRLGVWSLLTYLFSSALRGYCCVKKTNAIAMLDQSPPVSLPLVLQCYAPANVVNIPQRNVSLLRRRRELKRAQLIRQDYTSQVLCCWSSSKSSLPSFFCFLLALFKLQVKKDAEQQGHRKHSGDCRRVPYSAAVSLTHTDRSKLSFKLFNSSYTLPILLLGWHFMMKKRGKNKNIYKLDEGTIAEQTMSNK